MLDVTNAPAEPGVRSASRGLHHRIVVAAILAGIALRVWAYAAGTPLWLDEILLSTNITDLPLPDLLTEPLALDQVAPRGFLLAERAAVLILGPTERALRLFPFLCGLAGLLLFARLAWRVLERTAATIAIVLAAIAVPFLKFGAEVKQYSSDATAASLLMLLAFSLHRTDASAARLVGAGLAGFAVSWFSQTSAMMMAAIGLAFTMDWLVNRDPRTGRVLVWTMPLWAIAATLALVLGTRSMTPSTRAFMQDFWADGFFPLPFTGLSDLVWFWNSGLTVFTDPTLLRYGWPAVYVALAIAGALSLWRHRPFVGLLVFSPVLVVMAAAVAQQYPFLGRLLMFLVPSTLLAIAAGIDLCRRLAARIHPVAGMATLAGCLWMPVLALAQAPPPYDLERWHEVLAYLQQHRAPGDVIYVWPISRIGVLHYGPQFGIGPGDFVTGECHRDDVRAYLRGVDRYRGTPRLWMLGSNARVFRPARSSVAGYLKAIAHQRDSLVLPSMTFGAVSLELYDLSDPVKLAGATSDSFPVEPVPARMRPGCRPWVQPDAALSVR